jgi:hypothetical protein
MEKFVIATTTTKVYPLPFPSLCKNAGEFPFLEITSPLCFWYDDIEEKSGKWLGISVGDLEQVIQEAGKKYVWVIEGDGARERQLKYWASHEPQIPRLTESAVLVIDGRLWGKILQENEIHRSELCPQLAGQIWSPELAWEYILSSPVFRPEYREMSWVVLFNSWGASENEVEQAYVEKELQAVIRAAKDLIEKDSPQAQLRPRHLRLAAGDAKEGSLRWYDLW